MVDADELQQLAVDIAREAGALARRRRDEGVRIAATKSALADIVTEADREVEQLIRDRLAQARPDDGFLGEESGAERGTSGVTWVVDPIDGTVNYAYGIPLRRLDRRRQRRADAGGVDRRDRRRVRPWSTSSSTRPAAGCVARLTAAGRVDGRGCRCPARHRVRLRPGDARRRSRARAASHAARTRSPSCGAASLDLAFVAAGRLDGYFERGLWPWDHAAVRCSSPRRRRRDGRRRSGRPGAR
jgi:myo-inositol-1(or 4)-monophosphatase